MARHQPTNATIQLYTKQPGDEGKAPVVIHEPECKAMEMSAALAVRHSGLPYYPLPRNTPGIPMVRVEFDPPEMMKSISHVDEIPTTLEFVDGTGERVPGSETIALSARLMAMGESWNDVGIAHTGGLDMDRDELADLIFDAYREATVVENETMHWKYLRDRLQSLKGITSHAATCILKGPAAAIQEMMEQHMWGFFPYPIPFPEERVQAHLTRVNGKLTMAFTPGG